MRASCRKVQESGVVKKTLERRTAVKRNVMVVRDGWEASARVEEVGKAPSLRSTGWQT